MRCSYPGFVHLISSSTQYVSCLVEKTYYFNNNDIYYTNSILLNHHNLLDLQPRSASSSPAPVCTSFTSTTPRRLLQPFSTPTYYTASLSSHYLTTTKSSTSVFSETFITSSSTYLCDHCTFSTVSLTASTISSTSAPPPHYSYHILHL